MYELFQIKKDGSFILPDKIKDKSYFVFNFEDYVFDVDLEQKNTTTEEWNTIYSKILPSIHYVYVSRTVESCGFS